MQERGWIEPIVERVVVQVLDSHTAQVRSEIVRRVMEEIAAAPGHDVPTSVEANPQTPASGVDAAALARAVAEIQLGTSQREILRALLDTSARYCARVALFVVKGSHATGWEGRGFANCEAVKDCALGETSPAVGRAIRDRVAASATVSDLDSWFLQEVGTPACGEARIVPLVLKDKVAALVYADSGAETAGLLDVGSLELLVLSTAAWLEVNSLRKQAQKEQSSAQADGHSATDGHAAATAVPAYSDPFAAHSPEHAMAAAASTSISTSTPTSEPPQPAASVAVAAPAPTAWGVIAEAQSAIAETESVTVEANPAAASWLATDASTIYPNNGHANTEATAEAAPVSSMSPEDQDVHSKAQRFARLLVDEIKLYNQAKVSEGRKNRDLYDRLKEVIEKSRVTYQKRYGSTVAASGNYFHHEIIRSLAEDDLSIMGANFRH
jgi:hypothetical protein